MHTAKKKANDKKEEGLSSEKRGSERKRMKRGLIRVRSTCKLALLSMHPNNFRQLWNQGDENKTKEKTDRYKDTEQKRTTDRNTDIPKDGST